ncbi:MAG: fluoride efflux transporter CrcB [Chloroflexi bacterium]|nr:fluoride efflux transporter CrcB [Chloroflexota bacterium]
MMTALLVGVGGLIGSMMRYLVGVWVQSMFGSSWIPYGTLTVNVVGCFLIGLIVGWAETRQFLGEGTRALVVVGLLGGFTTFSAFGYETIAMAREGHMVAAAANVGLQAALGLAAVWIGLTISQSFSQSY